MWNGGFVKYPVAGPWITHLEESYVSAATRDGWYDRAGEWISRFELAFAAAVGRERAFSLPSCTAGLHLALAALGVGPGDEVVVPDATWIASAAPVTYVGATPVFADMDADTWCMSAPALKSALSPRTKAVIVVDLYGSMPDWPDLLEVAGAHGVPVIEDAAEAIGSRWDDRPAGSFGVASAFSFHGSKTMSTGEGGMLVVDDEALAERIAILRDHGRRPGDTGFVNQEVGFKYKMSPVQAALGCAQLERVDELVARKREIFSWYARELDGLLGFTLNAEPEQVHNSYWMVTAIVRGVDKRWLQGALRVQDVDTRPFFEPLSDLPAFADLPSALSARHGNPVVRSISPYGINLPSALCLAEDDVAEICRILRRTLQDAPA